MPFITEEIWQKIVPLTGKEATTIMLQPYPHVQSEYQQPEAVEELEWLKQMVLAIRNIRGEMNISPKKELPVLLQSASEMDKKWLKNNQLYWMRLAKLSSIEWLSDQDTPPPAATALVGDLKLFIPLADVIDKTAEIARLK